MRITLFDKAKSAMAIFPNAVTIHELRKTVGKMQNTISVLIAQSSDLQSKHGNPYQSYASMVTALALKYDGLADWGNQFAKIIVDLRAAFSIGGGVKAVAKKGIEAKKELEFVNQFIEDNDLDEELPQYLGQEVEIEGKCLTELSKMKVDGDLRRVRLSFIDWQSTGYIVTCVPKDYNSFEEVKYKDSNGKDVLIPKERFVYRRFGGRFKEVNKTPSKTCMILKQIEDLDKALWDWRKINRLFASPTPHLKCETKQQVEEVRAMLDSINWKIGKALVSTAALSYVEISSAASANIEKEIIRLATVISGATGIPVHFLGLPELMSNRAVSQDLPELINAATEKDRKIWKGFYEELFNKVLAFGNDQLQMGFKTNVLAAEIPYITQEKIRELVDVWLPLNTGRIISDKTTREKIPGLDVEQEEERIAEEKKSAPGILGLPDFGGENVDQPE